MLNYLAVVVLVAVRSRRTFTISLPVRSQSLEQDTDEKRRKEKEDVAELLGRKGSSGKKKKASLSKADPLGPPTLGKANPLEKKPLPGLSSKLGALGAIGGGPTIGGLRSATSLGVSCVRLRFRVCMWRYKSWP